MGNMVMNSGVARPKFWGGQDIWGEMLDIRQTTVFCLGYRLQKPKITRYLENLGGGTATPMLQMYIGYSESAYLLSCFNKFIKSVI